MCLGAMLGVIHMPSICFEPEMWEGGRDLLDTSEDASTKPNDENFFCSFPSFTFLFMLMHTINSILFSIAEVKN